MVSSKRTIDKKRQGKRTVAYCNQAMSSYTHSIAKTISELGNTSTTFQGNGRSYNTLGETSQFMVITLARA